MRHILYSMQFKGTGARGSESGVFKTATSATSCSVKTVVGPDGVEGAFIPAEGGMAFFESEVRMTGPDTFVETGAVSFGDDHSVRFTTLGQGHIAPLPNGKGMAGAVTWKVEGGEGQFQEASGLITSNFLVGEEGDMTDYQCGVIFTK